MNDDKSYRREDHSPVCTCFKCEAYDREQDARRSYEPERLNFCSKHQSWLCGCANAPRSLSNLIRKGGFAVLFTGLVIFGAWGAWVLLTTSQQDNIVSTPEPTVTDDALTPEMPPDDILVPDEIQTGDVLTPEMPLGVIPIPETPVMTIDVPAPETPATDIALNKAISLWTEFNPTIELEQLEVRFIDLPERVDHIGLYCQNGCDSGDLRGLRSVRSRRDKGYAEILIDTGGLSCESEWVAFSANYMASALSHLIGVHLSERYPLYEFEDYTPDSGVVRDLMALYDIPEGFFPTEPEWFDDADEIVVWLNAADGAADGVTVDRYNEIIDEYNCLYDGVREIAHVTNVVVDDQVGFNPDPVTPDDGNALKIRLVNASGNQRGASQAGIELWTDLNPTVNIQMVSGGNIADVVMTFIDLPEHADYVGLYCSHGCDSLDYMGMSGRRFRDDKGYAEILIDTGRVSCTNEWNAYHANSLANTVAHEIGHHLGLGHHRSEDHLLHGRYSPAPVPGDFDDLGYNIPSLLPYDGWLDAQVRIQERWDEIGDGWMWSNSLLNEWNSLVDEWNCLNNVD